MQLNKEPTFQDEDDDGIMMMMGIQIEAAFVHIPVWINLQEVLVQMCGDQVVQVRAKSVMAEAASSEGRPTEGSATACGNITIFIL